jgi:hypothetical protein
MGRGWIKVDTALSRSPEVRRIAMELSMNDVDLARAKVENVWMFADDAGRMVPGSSKHADALLPGHTFASLDRVANCPGLLDAMAGVGWAVQTGAGVILPAFGKKHRLLAADRRRAGTERQRRRRAKAKGMPMEETPKDRRPVSVNLDDRARVMAAWKEAVPNGLPPSPRAVARLWDVIDAIAHENPGEDPMAYLLGKIRDYGASREAREFPCSLSTFLVGTNQAGRSSPAYGKWQEDASHWNYVQPEAPPKGKDVDARRRSAIERAKGGGA